MGWWSLLLNPQVIIFLIVLAVAIYFIWKAEKRPYEFKGLTSRPVEIQPKKRARTKRVNKFEERCREIFEDIFDHNFPSTRPSFLKNPVTGQNLELDGYCPYIQTPIGTGLAFEYDGAQHAKYSPYFHRSKKEFIYQTKKDSYKDAKCRQKGIMLVRIPHTIKYEKLEEFIEKKLARMGVLT